MSNTTTFKVRALDERTQKITTETVDASDRAHADAAIRVRGMVPLEINAEGQGANASLSLGSKRPKRNEPAVFARMMATLIDAGVPILRAVEMCAEQAQTDAMRQVLTAVAGSINSGSTIYKAMAEHPEVFEPVVLNMVAAGEKGGFIGRAFENIATSQEKQLDLRERIKSAATYPVVVMIFGVLAAIGMILFIVPVFTGLFDGFGGSLPGPTQALVSLSEFLKVGIVPIVLAGAGLAWWWRKNKHREPVRRVVDPLKLRMPVFGEMFRELALGRALRNLSVMVACGVTVMESLRIVGGTAGNTVIEDALDRAAIDVERGKPLSEALTQPEVIPNTVPSMVRVGEESGRLDEMVGRVAQIYEDAVAQKTERMASALEPFLIVAIGGMVGSLVIALYMPMFSIMDQIR